EADLEPDALDRPVEEIREIGRACAGDIKRKPRQQRFDQIGLMEAKLMTLATAEKRSVPAPGIGRCLVISGIPAHRSVWHSRCEGRAQRLLPGRMVSKSTGLDEAAVSISLPTSKNTQCHFQAASSKRHQQLQSQVGVSPAPDSREGEPDQRRSAPS